MKTLHVNLAERSYDILIRRGILDDAGAHIKAVCPGAKRLFVVSDSHVAPLYYERLKASLSAAGFRERLYVIPAGEGSKNAQLLSTLWEEMADFGLTRTDAVVALGGGVVGDLCGLAAATILRGVDFVQIPTTLLAQVDSSVGGKVAIDLRHGKNLAGAFWQPKVVLMDPDTLDTLPDATFSDGMAEVIKYGCIADRDFFHFLGSGVVSPQTPQFLGYDFDPKIHQNDPFLHQNRAKLTENIIYVLYNCCDIKRRVVESDERDTGARMVLNFGHTLGHAYELAGNYEKWTHGQAVAAGMCAAARLGVELGVTAPEAVQPIIDLCAAFGLPTVIPCTRADYAAAIGLDKKGAGDQISVILLEDLGRAVAHKLSKSDLLALLP